MRADELDDYVLRVPRDLFKQQLADLLNNRTQNGWPDRVELFLEDSFTTQTAVERFKNAARPAPVSMDAWATRPAAASPATPANRAALSPDARVLADILRDADAFPHPGTRLPYYSERKTASGPGALDLRYVVSEYVRLIDDLTARGYLAQQLGVDCPDDHETPPASDIVAAQAGRDDLWPINTNALTTSVARGEGRGEPGSTAAENPDALFDLIEVVHDLVSCPRKRWMHGYAGCVWHYSDFSAAIGKAVYRWSVNRILDRSDLGLRLAGEGEDRGRLVAVTDDARTSLLHQMAERRDPGTGDRVRHAVALYRGRNATEHDKRSACIALLGVLEERRALLKENLVKKDEGLIFRLANEFAIRHQDSQQRGDYDPMFLDWMFWTFLSTVELSDRLVSRDQATGSAT